MAEGEKHFPGQAETETPAPEGPAPQGDKAPRAEPEAAKPEGDKPKPGEEKAPEAEKPKDGRGALRCSAARRPVAFTHDPQTGIEVSGTSARHSRVKSSTTARMRKRRYRQGADNKSRLQR